MPEEVVEYPVEYVPRVYQESGIAFLLENGSGGLLWDPGLGKTSAMLAAFMLLKRKKLVSHLIVVAPLRVMYSAWNPENEESDFYKFKQFQDLSVRFLHGGDVLGGLEEEHDVYVTNPEGLRKFVKQLKPGSKSYQILPEARKILSAKGSIMLAVDESSKFKHTNTHQYRQLKQVVKYVSRRYIMTGTFAPNGLLDLFGQVHIVDDGASLGRTLTAYRQTYFYPSGYGGFDWKLQDGSEERILEAIRPVCHRLDAEDWLDLPERIDRDIVLELPKKVRPIYREMEQEFIIQLRDNVVKAANAGVATSKLRQIANGGVYINHEDGSREIEHLHMVKAEATADLLEELHGQPTLVLYDTAHDLERLLRVLGKNSRVVGGGTTTKEQVKIEKEWNQGRLPFVLGQIQTVAHGLNLQKTGRAMIWHSLTYNLEDYIQGVRRIYRSGLTERMLNYHLVMGGTIDTTVRWVLRQKNTNQKTFLDALKRSYL